MTHGRTQSVWEEGLENMTNTIHNSWAPLRRHDCWLGDCHYWLLTNTIHNPRATWSSHDWGLGDCHYRLLMMTNVMHSPCYHRYRSDSTEYSLIHNTSGAPTQWQRPSTIYRLPCKVMADGLLVVITDLWQIPPPILGLPWVVMIEGSEMAITNYWW